MEMQKFSRMAPFSDVIFKNPQVSETLEEMFHNKKCCDTVFFVNEAQYHASSHVIAASNAKLDSIVSTHFENCGDREIKIGPLTHNESFLILLKYMYGVPINFTQMNKAVMCEVLDLCENYGFFVFSKRIESYFNIFDHFDFEILVVLLNTSKKHHLKNLYEKCLYFAFKNTDALVAHKSFASLKYDVLCELLDSDWFYTKEIKILKSVLDWHRENMNEECNRFNNNKSVSQVNHCTSSVQANKNPMEQHTASNETVLHGINKDNAQSINRTETYINGEVTNCLENSLMNAKKLSSETTEATNATVTVQGTCTNGENSFSDADNVTIVNIKEPNTQIENDSCEMTEKYSLSTKKSDGFNLTDDDVDGRIEKNMEGGLAKDDSFGCKLTVESHNNLTTAVNDCSPHAITKESFQAFKENWGCAKCFIINTNGDTCIACGVTKPLFSSFNQNSFESTSNEARMLSTSPQICFSTPITSSTFDTASSNHRFVPVTYSSVFGTTYSAPSFVALTSSSVFGLASSNNNNVAVTAIGTAALTPSFVPVTSSSLFGTASSNNNSAFVTSSSIFNTAPSNPSTVCVTTSAIFGTASSNPNSVSVTSSSIFGSASSNDSTVSVTSSSILSTASFIASTKTVTVNSSTFTTPTKASSKFAKTLFSFSSSFERPAFNFSTASSTKPLGTKPNLETIPSSPPFLFGSKPVFEKLSPHLNNLHDSPSKIFGSVSTTFQSLRCVPNTSNFSDDKLCTSFNSLTIGTLQALSNESKIPDNDSIINEDLTKEGEVEPTIMISGTQTKRTEEFHLTLWQGQCKLYRYNGKNWDKRGVGSVKLLKDKEQKIFRLFMRRDEDLEVCCNQHITPYFQLKSLKSKERTWTWYNQDVSDGLSKNGLFLLIFKSHEIATKFRENIENALAELKKSSPSSGASLNVIDTSSNQTIKGSFLEVCGTLDNISDTVESVSGSVNGIDSANSDTDEETEQDFMKTKESRTEVYNKHGITEIDEGEVEAYPTDDDICAEANISSDLVQHFTFNVLKRLLSFIRISQINALEMMRLQKSTPYFKYREFLEEEKYFSRIGNRRVHVQWNSVQSSHRHGILTSLCKCIFHIDAIVIANRNVLYESVQEYEIEGLKWKIGMKSFLKKPSNQEVTEIGDCVYDIYLKCVGLRGCQCRVVCSIQMISPTKDHPSLELHLQPITFTSDSYVLLGNFCWSTPGAYNSCNGVRTFLVDFRSFDFKEKLFKEKSQKKKV